MWVEVEDINKRWISDKPLPSDEKIEVIISDFESQVINRYPDIQVRIDSGKLPIDFVITTISRWIIEYLQTDGTPYSSETQTMYGVGSRSITVGSNKRTTTVLSGSDLSALAPKKSGRLISLHMNTNHSHNHHYRFWI